MGAVSLALRDLKKDRVKLVLMVVVGFLTALTIAFFSIGNLVLGYATGLVLLILMAAIISGDGPDFGES